jgi:hypothetical protein
MKGREEVFVLGVDWTSFADQNFEDLLALGEGRDGNDVEGGVACKRMCENERLRCEELLHACYVTLTTRTKQLNAFELDWI